MWQLDLPARRNPDTDARGIPTGHREDEHPDRLSPGRRGFDDGFDGVAAARSSASPAAVDSSS
jgi:hypothetical protein